MKPTERDTPPEEQAFPHHLWGPGASLRDLFAGLALNGNLPSYSAWTAREQHSPEQVARDAFAIADAMLAERAK